MKLYKLQENDSAAVTVCRAEITHVGKNMPCTDWAKINSSITYTSKNVVTSANC